MRRRPSFASSMQMYSAQGGWEAIGAGEGGASFQMPAFLCKEMGGKGAEHEAEEEPKACDHCGECAI